MSEGERERERDKQTDRQTETERDGERQRQRGTETKRVIFHHLFQIVCIYNMSCMYIYRANVVAREIKGFQLMQVLQRGANGSDPVSCQIEVGQTCQVFQTLQTN